MRISWNNLLKSATSLSATNTDLAYPVENLYHNYLELTFETTADNSIITAVFDDIYTINHIAYGYHNLNSMELRLYDVLDNLLDTITVTPIENGEGIFYFSTLIDNVKWIEIEVDTLDTYLYIGNLCVGEYLQMPDFVTMPEQAIQLSGQADQSGSGQVSGMKRRNLKNYSFRFMEVTDTKNTEIESYLTLMQNADTHYIDQCESNHSYRAPFFGFITSTEIPETHKRAAWNKWSKQINYREAR